MSIKIDEDALKSAASRMAQLKVRCNNLQQKLTTMYNDVTKALDTPAGKAMSWEGGKEIITPIDSMSKVIGRVSDILNILVGLDGETVSGPKNVYYDKIFKEYEDLDRILKNKSK